MKDANQIAQELYDYIELQFDEDPTYEMIRAGVEKIAAALREYGEACVKKYLETRGQMAIEEQVQKLQALDLDRVNQIAKADAEGYRRGVEEGIQVSAKHHLGVCNCEKLLQHGKGEGA